MSNLDDVTKKEQEEPPKPTGGDYAPSVAARLAFYQRAGGIITPVLTTVFAFLMGGVVVAATGHNPFAIYKAIFNGTGLTWIGEFFDWLFRLIFPIANVAFPNETSSAVELRLTMLLWTSFALTGLAVAFAFRCGLFNIGGNGQYLAGAMTSIWIGTHFPQLPNGLHVLFAVVAAALVGALWAAIAGFLKATVGAHEVITTIMLNFVASWIAQFLVGRDGPMQTKVDDITPESDEVFPGARLPALWKDPLLAGLGGDLHIGFLVSIGALVVYWLLLNRTTLGYEVRATGFNPEAARYGGISVTRSYVTAMAISGLFAGLAGAIDYLGWLFKIGVLDIQITTAGFIGIAVALLGRNNAVGIALGALIFAGLINGTSTRNPEISDVFRPELAGNLTQIIMGLVLLFIGADLLILYLWNIRRKLGFGKPRSETGPSG